jgi:uncharacterized damage-inducible protein DinB
MSTLLQELLDSIRTARRAAFNRLAGTPEEHLGRMTRWGNGPADARYLFLRFSDHEEEHALQVAHTLRARLDWQPSKVQLTLAMAERTRGDVLAALMGLTDEDLDTAPVEPAGEWTLRQILSHLAATEHSYRINTLHAVERHQQGEPHGDLPGRGDDTAYRHLPMAEMLVALDTARAQSIAELAVLPDSVLGATAFWSGFELDVNWRLMRFSHHEREHAAHIQKWRVQTDNHQTDAQRLLGLAWQSHGLMRGNLVGVPDELVDRDPGQKEWSIRQVLQHVRESDGFFERMIEAAE